MLGFIKFAWRGGGAVKSLNSMIPVFRDSVNLIV